MMIRYYKDKKLNFYYKISPLKKGENSSSSFKENGTEYKVESITTAKGYESYHKSCVENAVSISTKKISKKEWDKALIKFKEFIDQLK